MEQPKLWVKGSDDDIKDSQQRHQNRQAKKSAPVAAANSATAQAFANLKK